MTDPGAPLSPVQIEIVPASSLSHTLLFLDKFTGYEVRLLASVHSPYIIAYKQAFIESNSLWYYSG